MKWIPQNLIKELETKQWADFATISAYLANVADITREKKMDIVAFTVAVAQFYFLTLMEFNERYGLERTERIAALGYKLAEIGHKQISEEFEE